MSWDTFFHRRVPPHLWATVRIAVGLFLMLYWYTQVVEAHLFSQEGFLFPRVESEDAFSLLLFHPTYLQINIFFIGVFILLFFFTCGYAVQLSAFILLLCFLYFHVLSQWLFSTSFYRIFQFVLALFLFPGGDRTFSLAMRIKHGSFFAWEPISILPQRILALQMSATYFCVGWQKLFLPGWKNGHILVQGFSGFWATGFARFLLQRFPSFVFDWMLWGSLVLELLLPFGLWSKKYQGWFFVGGFLFHTMVTLTLGIWWFQALVPLYIVFLVPEDIYLFYKQRSKGRIH